MPAFYLPENWTKKETMYMADYNEQSREAIEDIQGAYEIPKRSITAGDGNAYTTTTTNGGSANQPGKSVGDLSIKLDVDCSEALTGLKAIQREAKKATQALRELEEVESEVVTKRVNIEGDSTTFTVKGDFDVTEVLEALNKHARKQPLKRGLK